MLNQELLDDLLSVDLYFKWFLMYSGKSGLSFTLILVLKAVLKYWTPCPFAPLEFRLTDWQLKAIAPVNISTGQQDIKKNTVAFKAHGFH